MKVMLGIVACAACVAQADIDLNGSWGFRFEERKAIEETAGPAFEATDTMTVPGCYDTMPKWFLKRGTGLYRRYNARRDRTADGRYYSDAYASKILSRAKDLGAFVPIEIKLAK